MVNQETRERVELALKTTEPNDKAPGGTHTLSDARHVAQYFRLQYAPSGEGERRVPGLADAKLPATHGADVQCIVEEIEKVNVLLYAKGKAPSLPRIRAAESRLLKFLDWLAWDDAGLADQLANLRKAHADSASADDRLVALAETLLIAEGHRAALEDIPAFDRTLFGDARKLVRGPRLDAAKLGDRRVLLCTLLQERVQRIVAAADLVYGQGSRLARAARSDRQLRRAAAIARARRKSAASRPSDPATPVPAATPAPAAEPTA